MSSPSPQYSKTSELIALGKQIKELRLARGLSQDALAAASGLERSYIGGIERGENNVSLIKLKHVAEALDITVAELIRRAGF